MKMTPDSEVQAWACAVIRAVDKPDIVLAMSTVIAHMPKYRAWRGKLGRGPGRANRGLKPKIDFFKTLKFSIEARARELGCW